MKKNYILLLLFSFVCTSHAQVDGIFQVPNGNFEAESPANEIRHWGQFFIIPVSIELETGNSYSDVVLFDDGRFCTTTTDSYSGQKAMKITNAFNETQNIIIPGKSSLFNEEMHPVPGGWNTGIPIPEDADVDFLAFHYKFNALGNDIAEARLELFDADGNNVGVAKKLISESATAYTYVSVPVEFTSDNIPVFMTISFSMATEGSVPVFGSSLIIDEVSISDNLMRANDFQQTAFSVYPTAADSEINIQKSTRTTDGVYRFKIVNLEGKIVNETALELRSGNSSKINISALSSGIYFLRSEDGFTAKFIRK